MSLLKSVYNLIGLPNFLFDLFCPGLSAQGVVALKNEAVFPEFAFLETVHCPRIIAVFAGPYCASVGLSLSPFRIPLC